MKVLFNLPKWENEEGEKGLPTRENEGGEEEVEEEASKKENQGMEKELHEKLPTYNPIYDIKKDRWFKDIPFTSIPEKGKDTEQEVNITNIIYKEIVRKLACNPLICRVYDDTEKKNKEFSKIITDHIPNIVDIRKVSGTLDAFKKWRYIHYVIKFEENTLCTLGTGMISGIETFILQCNPLPWKLKIQQRNK